MDKLVRKIEIPLAKNAIAKSLTKSDFGSSVVLLVDLRLFG